MDRDRRRVDVVFSVGAAQQAHLDRALRELKLAIAGIDAREAHLHVVAQAHRRHAVELHFGVRCVAGRDVVRREHRCVDRGVDRSGGVAALHRDGSIDEAEARNADAVGVVTVRARGERGREGKQKSGDRYEQRGPTPGIG